MTVPVIAIDGPAASGKGTIAQRAADALGWHYLDSGALYRLAALAALRAKVSLTIPQRSRRRLNRWRLNLRMAAFGSTAKMCRKPSAPKPWGCCFEVRRCAGGAAGAFRPAAPCGGGSRTRCRRARHGDGGFPEAKLKIFYDGFCPRSAERRVKQLEARGEKADLAALTRDLEERDRRDRERAVAPLKPAADARLLDTSEMGIDEVVKKCSVGGPSSIKLL